MESDIVKWVEGWALDRLSERNTWATWISLAGVHLGGVINPQLDPLLINAATALVAVVGFVISGKPIFEKQASK